MIAHGIPDGNAAVPIYLLWRARRLPILGHLDGMGVAEMKRGVVYGGMAGATWGLVILIPGLLPEFSPLLLSCARFGLYGLVSLLLALPVAPRLLRRLTGQDVLKLVELAVTGNILYYLLLAAAIQLAGVACAALIVGVVPVTVTLLGRRDADAVPLRRLAAPLLLVVAGIVCINLETLLFDRASPRPLGERLLGIACAFAALGCWTWFAAANARHLKQSRFDSGEWSTLWGIATGLLAGLLWLGARLLVPDSLHMAASPARWTTFWLLSLSSAVLGSWLGNRLWNAASRSLPLTLTGQLIVFETLFALLYGFLYLQRLPSPLEILAIGLLGGGVVWAVRCHAAPPAPAAA